MASCEKCAEQFDTSTTFTGEDSPLCQNKRSCTLRMSQRCRYCQKPFTRVDNRIRHKKYTSCKQLENGQRVGDYLNATLVIVVKSSVVKMLDSAIKGFVQSDQTLNPYNLAPIRLRSCHLRQVPHPPYFDWKLHRKVEWVRTRPATYVFVY